ncbi:MAG: hypothetical protein RLZZ28_1381 [Bacteroidota bacterium]
MVPYLYKYLLLNNQLRIPGLGSFFIKLKSAHYPDDSPLLNGPVPAIYFLENQAEDIDGRLVDYLLAEMGEGEYALMVERLKDFSGEMHAAMNTSGKAILPGMGVLNKTATGILFNSLVDMAGYLPILDSSAKYEAGSDLNALEPGDKYWKTAAIILWIIGLGALIYYYV